jgi:competence protein ComEA
MSTIRSMLLLFAMLLPVPAVVLADPVDINSADAETLASSIDGVGTQKAIAIVQYREANGPFSTLDDLAKVQGIGMKTVDNNRGKLTVVTPSH